MVRSLINVFIALVVVAVGFVAAAFSIAGVVDANAAHIILLVAWLVCIFWVYAAEHFRSKSLKQILPFCCATAVIAGVILLGVDRWIVRTKSSRQDAASESKRAETSDPVDIGAEIARSRQSADTYQSNPYPANKNPILRRTQSGQAQCADPPNHPVLNYWPVSFTDPVELCHEFPMIDVRRSNGLFSQSAEDWASGVTAKTGDQFDVVIYIANGAASIVSDPQRVLAKNVFLTTRTDTHVVGSLHYVDVSAAGDNVETVYGRFVIKTEPTARLELIPRSGQVWDTAGHPLAGGFAAGNNIIRLGDLRSAFGDALFITYRVRVVNV